MVIWPEVINHHLFNNGVVKVNFSKMCHRKNLLTSVGCSQGIIFQPSRHHYFGHSTLSLSKYGKGVYGQLKKAENFFITLSFSFFRQSWLASVIPSLISGLHDRFLTAFLLQNIDVTNANDTDSLCSFDCYIFQVIIH